VSQRRGPLEGGTLPRRPPQKVKGKGDPLGGGGWKMKHVGKGERPGGRPPLMLEGFGGKKCFPDPPVKK